MPDPANFSELANKEAEARVLHAYAEALVRAFRERGLTLAVAESCTGGLVADLITDVPGSSEVLKAGVVSYTDEAKHQIVGVSTLILKHHGAVSARCAEEMADGVRSVARADVGLSTTGFAGPSGGTEEDPVGTVYLGFAYVEDGVSKTAYRRESFPDRDRREVKLAAARMLLRWLLEWEKLQGPLPE